MCMQWAGTNRQGCSQQYMQENCRKTCALCRPVTQTTAATSTVSPLAGTKSRERFVPIRAKRGQMALTGTKSVSELSQLILRRLRIFDMIQGPV